MDFIVMFDNKTVNMLPMDCSPLGQLQNKIAFFFSLWVKKYIKKSPNIWKIPILNINYEDTMF